MPRLSPAAILLATLLAFVLAGCPDPAPPPATTAEADPSPLRLVVVDDPALGQAISREWQAQTEQPLEVLSATSAEVSSSKRLSGDAIVFPSGLIGELIEGGLIVPLSDAALGKPEFNRRDIFDLVRLREIVWGDRTVAVPLGSPQLLLAYRSDIFDQLGLSVPTNWEEYQQVLEKLADRSALAALAPPDDQPWRASVEPLADGWAGQTLFVRSAAYAMHRDQLSPLLDFETAAPLIDQPPYVRALRELAAAAKTGGFADQSFTPAEAMDELLTGRCAMALAWPIPEPGAKPDESPIAAAIRFALVPGAAQSFDLPTKTWEERSGGDPAHVPVLALAGRLAAVAKNSVDPERTESFLVWLAGHQISGQVGPQSQATTLFRKSQVSSPTRWVGKLPASPARQYSDTLAAAMSIPQAFPGLRLPGRAEYLAALDAAVQEAAAAKTTPAEALKSAAAKWAEITASRGVEAQQAANRRSLGLADLP